MAKKVISRKSSPSFLPLFQTLTVALALDRWHAPQWLWGAVGLLLLMVWIMNIYGLATEEHIDVIDKVDSCCDTKQHGE